MHDKAFLDTNILIYLYSVEKAKQNQVFKLLASDRSFVISRQVIHEFCNVLLKNFSYPIEKIQAAIEDFTRNFLVIELNTEITNRALIIHRETRFSFYDCLVVSSALLSGCKELFSEDMHDGMKIQDTLKIINPFK
jgi:predicted nucleic acid-binding protein